MTRKKASPDPQKQARLSAPAQEVGSAELPEVVATLRARKNAVGLRRVAREVGMSPSGIQKVLDGSTPFRTTHLKLQQWLTRHRSGQYETARDAAMDILLQGLPRAQRERAREQITALIASYHPRPGTTLFDSTKSPPST